MRKHFLFLLTFTSALIGLSQPVYLNPFSSYGIGHQNLASDAIQASMGGSSIAFNDSTMISYLNAANIASLTQSYPLFSVGINGSMVNFSEGPNVYNRGFVALDHLIFAIPFKKRYGVAFGLSPYARRGYTFQGEEAFGTDTTLFEYSGKGSISKAFVGLSYKIINGKKLHFSVGSNLGYLFGTTANSRASSLSSNSFSGLSLRSDRMQSFHYDLSVNAGYAFNSSNRLQINAYIDPSQRLGGTYTDELYAITNTGGTSLVAFSSFDATTISATSMRFGANYSTQFQRTSKKNKSFTSELTFTGEYTTTAYSAFRKDYNAQSFASYTGDYTRMSFGIQYTPSVGYYKSVAPTGFLTKLKYRAGTYSSTLPYSSGGENFTEFGTTFGIGIPMVSSNTYSSLNLGVDLGKKTNGVAGALTENYLGFHIGIIIAPSKADYWFRKVKLD